MRISSDDQTGLAKATLLFVVHQLISTIGVIVSAGVLASVGFGLLRFFGRDLPAKYLYWTLTGTPYFPMQIAVGLVLGWFLGRRLRTSSMAYVWILPLVFLCYLFIALPTTAASLARDARFSHFFGWGCRPENRCFDQLGATLPFYAATAYTIGAVIARKWGSEKGSGASAFRRVDRSLT
jgi:hypothetical protein